MMTLPIQAEMDIWLKKTASLPDAILELPWKWQSYDEGIRFAFFRLMEEIITLAGNPDIFKLDSEKNSQKEVNTYLLRFHRAFWQLKAKLTGLDEGLANQQPTPQDWSIRRTAEHILEAEWMFYGVFRYGFHASDHSENLPSEKPNQDFIDQHFDVEGGFPPDKFECSLVELLMFYEKHHSDVLSGLSSLKDDDLERSLTFWEDEAMSARFRLIRFESHLRQHLIQIKKTAHQLQFQYSEVHALIQECISAFSSLDWYLRFPEQLNLEVLEKQWEQLVRPYLQITSDVAV